MRMVQLVESCVGDGEGMGCVGGGVKGSEKWRRVAGSWCGEGWRNKVVKVMMWRSC